MKTYSQFITEASGKGQPQEFEHGVKPGDIYYYSWGYDQTNIDWYQVISVTKASAKLKKLEDKKSSDGSTTMTGKTVPIPNKFQKDAPITRRISSFSGEPYMKMDHGGLSPWDGKPKRFSTYA